MTEPLFLTGARVLTPAGIGTGQGVLTEAGRIAALLPETAAPAARRLRLPTETLLAPGFIDVQVNGGGGILFNDDPTPEAARAIARAHRPLGTTGILPTLITSPPDTFARAAAAAPRALGHGVLGIHFEGPFLSPDKPGVHRRDCIRAPTPDDIERLTTLARHPGLRVLVTLAPECVDPAVQSVLAEAGILLSAGHSTASPAELGAPVVAHTHLFNAMAPITARAPGLAAVGLTDHRFAGIIMDLIHVDPALLRLLIVAKRPDRILLVSDSMSVAGTDATGFRLDGRPIHRRNGRLETADGTLAGADLSLAQAVRNAVTALGVPLETAIAWATAVPADLLRMTGERGRIAPGLAADLVLLSPKLDVLATMLAGDWEAEPGIAC